MAVREVKAARVAALETPTDLKSNAVRDIAAALNLRPGATRVLLHRARRRLGDALRLQVLVNGHGSGCPDFRRANTPCAAEPLTARGSLNPCPVRSRNPATRPLKPWKLS